MPSGLCISSSSSSGPLSQPTVSPSACRSGPRPAQGPGRSAAAAGDRSPQPGWTLPVWPHRRTGSGAITAVAPSAGMPAWGL